MSVRRRTISDFSQCRPARHIQIKNRIATVEVVALQSTGFKFLRSTPHSAVRLEAAVARMAIRRRRPCAGHAVAATIRKPTVAPLRRHLGWIRIRTTIHRYRADATGLLAPMESVGNVLAGKKCDSSSSNITTTTAITNSSCTSNNKMAPPLFTLPDRRIPIR